MAKRKKIADPLEGIDPVMEQVFSIEEADDRDDFVIEPREPVGRSAVPARTDEIQTDIADVQFPELAEEKTSVKVEEDVFSNIPVTVSVELGRSQISLKELYELSEGSLIELQRLVGEPLDLVVNNQIVAQGEVVAIDNNYGLRITQILTKTPG